ncbi:MAG TPA: NAD(P)H-hydrate dehydratase [Candidatus Binatia bacterium]|nr:NAD(P)H-hydrate dehydratase [Candidatus Binatia bacterium]
MAARSLTRAWVAERLPARPDRAHKGDFGRLLVVGGSIDYPGAPLLAALGAMRAGVGLARVAAAESVVARLAGTIAELTWMALDEEAPGLIAPGGWRHLATNAPGYDAVVIGPGLGRQPTVLRRTRQLVVGLTRPAVVDADGLNALAGDARWWEGIRAPLVLTPHPGEFRRLVGRDAPDADDDEGRADAAATAAARWNQVVVLKGAHSVVAGPGGEVLRADVATPALATAGSGDVLSGVIGAYLAAGSSPLDAAACGVAVHGAAGLLAAERIGSAGVMARDIAALLPEAAARMRGGPAR